MEGDLSRRGRGEEAGARGRLSGTGLCVTPGNSLSTARPVGGAIYEGRPARGSRSRIFRSALPERVLRGEPGADLNLLASVERYWSHRRDDDDETRNTKT